MKYSVLYESWFFIGSSCQNIKMRVFRSIFQGLEACITGRKQAQFQAD
jgi:hypothetical protein